MKLPEGVTEYKMDWGMQVSNSVMTLTSTIRQECVGGGGNLLDKKWPKPWNLTQKQLEYHNQQISRISKVWPFRRAQIGS